MLFFICLSTIATVLIDKDQVLFKNMSTALNSRYFKDNLKISFSIFDKLYFFVKTGYFEPLNVCYYKTNN